MFPNLGFCAKYVLYTKVLSHAYRMPPPPDKNMITILPHCLGIIRLKFCGIAGYSGLMSLIEPGFHEYSADPGAPQRYICRAYCGIGFVFHQRVPRYKHCGGEGTKT